jgi:hypothetical protein
VGGGRGCDVTGAMYLVNRPGGRWAIGRVHHGVRSRVVIFC